MAEAIFSDLSLIPVINRLGIFLGVGDLSVGEVCTRDGVDPGFFLAVVNTFLNENYFPEGVDTAFPVDRVLDYLSLTDEYYASVQLPNIARHFSSLMDRSPGHNNLRMLLDFFEETRGDLLDSIRADREIYFPLVRRMARGERVVAEREVAGLVTSLSRRGIAEKVGDLSAFFVRHLRGEYDSNLCFAVMTAVAQLARDISQNNRIRERILCSMVEKVFI